MIITEEDVQHATQERGAVDALPQIRNRLGLRRALNAALVRFPAFSRIRHTHRFKELSASGSGNRSRSKSASSTSQSVLDGASEAASSDKLSRHPSDANSRDPASRKKTSGEFGVDIRRIISGGRDSSPQRSSTPSTPAPNGSRGGWGARLAAQQLGQTPTKETPSAFPELARSISASSIGGGGGGRRRHLFPSRKNSDRDSRASSMSGRTDSPTPPSDTESSGRRKISQIISRLGNGGRSTPRQNRDRKGSLSDDESIPESLQEAAATPIVVESIPAEAYNPMPTRSAFDILQAYEDDEILDTSDYSSDEDYDELADPPITSADGISGWQSGFHSYDLGVRGEGINLLEDDESKYPSSFPLDESTPRASAQLAACGIDPNPSATPPPLVHQFSSDSPSSRTLRNSSSTVRDGSIKNGFEPSGPRKWQVYHDENCAFDDEEEEEEGTEIFVAPRRKRAATVVD